MKLAVISYSSGNHMNVKFNGTHKVLGSFNLILKKDEKAELSFEFDDWLVFIGLIFKEDNEIENSKFNWTLEDISNLDLEHLPLDIATGENVDDIFDSEFSRPLFTCTNWNKSKIIYEPKKPVGEHQNSDELRLRMSVQYKSGFYETHLMFYAINKKKVTSSHNN
jgi:hypothetical protein